MTYFQASDIIPCNNVLLQIGQLSLSFASQCHTAVNLSKIAFPDRALVPSEYVQNSFCFSLSTCQFIDPWFMSSRTTLQLLIYLLNRTPKPPHPLRQFLLLFPRKAQTHK